MFRILSELEYNALDAKARAEYDKALEAFVAEFQAQYPNGFEARLRIKSMSLTAIPGKDGKEATYSFSFVTDNDILNANLPNGRMSRPVSNANIIAKNAQFANWPHMAMTLQPLANKGAFIVRTELHIKGDTYGTGLKKGVYKRTTLSQTSFEYDPSAEVLARYAKLTEAAATKGFNDLLFVDTTPQAAPAAVSAIAGEPDADI